MAARIKKSIDSMDYSVEIGGALQKVLFWAQDNFIFMQSMENVDFSRRDIKAIRDLLTLALADYDSRGELSDVNH